MVGLDLTTVLLLIVALAVVLLALDFLFAGGGMTGAMMHGSAMMLGSPYGWALIVALVLIVLAVFGFSFR